MSEACRVRHDEIAHDPSPSRYSPEALEMRSEIRMEVIDVADRLVRGETNLQVFRHGKPYTFDTLMTDFSEHKLHDSVVFKAWNGDRMPLTDLITRIAQRAVADSWYGAEFAESLGFAE